MSTQKKFTCHIHSDNHCAIPSGRNPHALYCDEPSLTKQSFAEECDINEILRRAANGQDISGALSARVASYGDFVDVPTFIEAQNVTARANSMFAELPWQIRERFDNKPEKMLAFLENEENYDEAVKLGLVQAKPPKEEDKGPKDLRQPPPEVAESTPKGSAQ